MCRRILLIIILIAGNFVSTFSQGIVINGGATIRISSNAFLVVDNPSANAIKRVDAGHIITEGDLGRNRVRWMIGNTSNTYTVPFGMGTNTYLPLTLTTKGAQGSGFIDFSTYATETWKNSDYLPAIVTNINDINNVDNSANVLDRFWRLEAQNYINKPNLIDVSFSYRDIEHTVPNNSIVELNLQAQRWNSDIKGWGDYQPQGVANVVDNHVIVPLINNGDFYTWWVLVDKDNPLLPLELLSFKALLETNSRVGLTWKTSQEVNVSHFDIERSTNGINFTKIGQKTAVGNSQVEQTYYYPDKNLPAGATVLYYRLKMIDVDNSYKYSPVEVVRLAAGNGDWKLYPNPSTIQGYAYLQVPADVAVKEVQFYDESGRLMSSHRQNGVAGNGATIIQLPVQLLSSGYYSVRAVCINGLVKTFKFTIQR